MGALDIALHILLSENPAYRNIPFPDNTEEKRMLLRTLQNVRPPYPVNEDFLKAQDAELQRQMAEKGIVALSDIEPCRKDRRLRLWPGDITRLQVDAIVNAANSALLGCFVPMHRCIDNAIHSAAGVQLRLACDRLMQEQEHPEPTGRAKITDGYNLPARYVLHTVGPIVRNDVLTPKQEQDWQTVTTPVLLWRMRMVCKASLSAASLRASSDFQKGVLPILPSALCGRILIRLLQPI